ncbi:MAG: hypothetical protein IPM56_10150 [Ignavibacteriales bacterium]|nr:MAG: hypothetical protein IPM56_10150 [Ignavibacteriales bacterium]
MNRKLIEYLDGALSPEESKAFNQEIGNNPELMKEYLDLKSLMKQSSVYKDAKISEYYFDRLIPSFREKNLKQERKFTPAFAAAMMLIFAFATILLFKNGNNFAGNQIDELASEMSKEEINKLYEEKNLSLVNYNFNDDDKLTIDSLISSYITADIIFSNEMEKQALPRIDFNPDELEISDAEAEELFTAILNKKFFEE